MGSCYLPEYFSKHYELLAADYSIWAAERKDALGRPQVSLGTKGFLYIEIGVTANRIEIHSFLASLEMNPVAQLSTALNSIVGIQGKCKLKEFYDSVSVRTELELSYLSNVLLPGSKTIGEVDLLQKYIMELINSPFAQMTLHAAGYAGFEEPVILPNSPVSGLMCLVGFYLKAPAIAIGVGDAHSKPHGLNESISIDDYFCGIDFVSCLIQQLSRKRKGKDLLI